MKKPIALLLSVLLVFGTVFVTPASAYAPPVTVKEVEQSVQEVSQGYGNVEVMCTFKLENGVGSGLLELYYEDTLYEFDSVYGYDEYIEANFKRDTN